jgi:hypothetical protein
VAAIHAFFDVLESGGRATSTDDFADRPSRGRSSTMMIETETTARPGAVLIAVEAKNRGFKTVDTFRRWCRRLNVPVHLTGRRAFVCPADIDRAIVAAPTAPPPATPPRAAVADAVSTIIARTRGGR